MDILYNAYLGTNSSWSIVGRETVRGLTRLGHRVKAVSTNGWSGVPKDIMDLVSVSVDHPSFLGYTIPYKLSMIGTNTRFLIYNYESSVLPAGWANLINKYADLVLPASKYSADVMNNSGVNKDKIKIFPYGVDSTVFKKSSNKPYVPKDKFNFLYCAIPHARKGIDILFRTYFKAFTDKDNVRLILKTSKRYKQNKNNPVFAVDIDKLLEKSQQEAGGVGLPEVKIISDNLSLTDLVRLYNSANVYIVPSRSEGFGMTVLEAMACEVPIIATNYSAHTDFLNSDNALLIDTKEVLAPQSMQYWQYQKHAVIGQPDEDQIIDYMKYMYQHMDDSRVGPALQMVRNKYTWDKSVAKLEKAMLERLSIINPSKQSKNYNNYMTRSKPSTVETVSHEKTLVRRPMIVPSKVINSMSRSDIRVRQTKPVARRGSVERKITAVSRAQSSIKKPLSHKPNEIKTISQRRRRAKINNIKSNNMIRAASVSSGRSNIFSTNKIVSKPTAKRVVALFMGDDKLNYIITAVYKMALESNSYDIRFFVYKKPDFLTDDVDVTIIKNDEDFAKEIRKLPEGSILVTSQTILQNRAFKGVMWSIKPLIYCACDSMKIPSRYQVRTDIVFLYDSAVHLISQDLREFCTLNYDINREDNIFDIELAVGGELL